jgi:glycosyltransferase involved in cell wall biosynthesis
VPLRVAHFIQRYPPALGGSEAYFARLSRHLAAAGEDVSVFTTTALDLEAFWSRRGRCVEALSLFPHRGWQCLTLPCNPISFRLWRESGRPDRPFDVVHAAAFPYAFPIMCARRLAGVLGVPFVVTPFLHLGDPDDSADPTRRAYTTPALMSLLHGAERVFVQTPGERDELLRQGLAGDKLILQGLGVDLDECTGGARQAARRQWQTQPHEVVIGHLANNSFEKGTIDLLRAVQILSQRRLPVRAILAGPEMPNFQRFWQAFACTAPIVRLGVLDEQQKKDFFAGLDIFALPSRSDSFGLVLLEAWANGVPNVAYRAGGIADVLRHDQDGLLVRCGKIDELADALTGLVEDEAARRRLGRAGRDRLAHEFRWSDKLDLVRHVYRELVAQSCAPGARV